MDQKTQINHLITSLQNTRDFGQNVYPKHITLTNIATVEYICRLFTPDIHRAFCEAFDHIFLTRRNHPKWLLPKPQISQNNHYLIPDLADTVSISIKAWQIVLKQLDDLITSSIVVPNKSQIHQLIDYYELILHLRRPTDVRMTSMLIQAVNQGVSTFGGWLPREYMVRTYDTLLDHEFEIQRSNITDHLRDEGYMDDEIIYELLSLEIETWRRVHKYIRLEHQN